MPAAVMFRSMPVPRLRAFAAIAWGFAAAAGLLRADEPDSPAKSDAAAARDMMERAIGAAADGPEAAASTPDVELAKLSAQVAAKQLEARRLAQRKPGDALALLEELVATVDAAGIPDASKAQFKRRIDRTRLDIEQASGKRTSELALDRKNAQVEAQIDREREIGRAHV